MSEEAIPTQASSVKKGHYLLMDDHPCVVKDTSTSKTGKHGHAKISFMGVDIFTGQKMEMRESTTHNVMVPIVTRTEYILLDINDDDFTSLMLEATGEVREDIKVPNDETGEKMRSDFDSGKEVVVCVWKAMGIEKIMSCKENKN